VKLTAAGIVVGLPLAQWARPALAGLLYEAAPYEPLAIAGVPLLFVAVAIAASVRPARRAAATDPVLALRQE
jgi:putative ABC transport system permease protein